MRYLFVIVCFVTLGLGLGPYTARSKTLALEPSSDWRLREYDDKCRISRTYGTGEDRLTLWVDKGGPGPSFNITLIGRPVRSPYGPTIGLTFSPGEEVRRNYIKSKSSKGRPVIAMFGVQPVSLEPEQAAAVETEEKGEGTEEKVDLSVASVSDVVSEDTLKARYTAVTSMDLKSGVIDPISLKMVDLLEMAEPLFACSQELALRLEGRTLDGGDAKGKPSTPRDQKTWAKKIQANYPLHLLREGEEGSVGVRLTVNKAGRASFCEVISYSGPASFNDTACLLLLRHAVFNPALDAEGNPHASFYKTTVTYSIRK
ncbi:MAG: energy transducer TonB [Pseudomonadota bacterium]